MRSARVGQWSLCDKPKEKVLEGGERVAIDAEIGEEIRF